MTDQKDPNRPPVQAFADTNGNPLPPDSYELRYVACLAKLNRAEDLLLESRAMDGRWQGSIDQLAIENAGLHAKIDALKAENSARRESVTQFSHVAGLLSEALHGLLFYMPLQNNPSGELLNSIHAGQEAMRSYRDAFGSPEHGAEAEK
jgi:hypothetical protein